MEDLGFIGWIIVGLVAGFVAEKVMGGNAARYLGLDRSGKQRARLDTAYADHPIYQDIFNE